LDADLIHRARHGDETAYQTLVEQHQEDVFRLAYLLLGDADDAADVTQETFIRAFRHLERFDAARPPRPWLLGIARNLARNRQRTLRRYLNMVRRLSDGVVETSSAEMQTQQQWEAQALWQAIRRLDTSDREVIYLRYFLELSVSETAEILNVKDGTVKSRLSRTLRRLRMIIHREFPSLAKGPHDERPARYE
jgi:RNA polymerase sigma factor (sigma-70 family)